MGSLEHIKVKTEAEKRAYQVCADNDCGDIDDAYVYARTTSVAESFMIEGNGPSAWVWFVFTEDGDIDHAYIEYADASKHELAPIPADYHRKVYRALGGKRL